MDYKYIDQLLERYWACETSLQEEQILHTFFEQQDIPAHLEVYRMFFKAEQEISKAHLSKDFDEKILNLVGEKEQGTTCTARTLHLSRRIRPFYKAAGMVAMLLTIGMAAQHSFQPTEDNCDIYAQEKPIEDDSEFTITPDANVQSATLDNNLPADTLSSVMQTQKSEMSR